MKRADRRAGSMGPGELESRRLEGGTEGMEDALYLQADKLLALCSVQTTWSDADLVPGPATRHHYSLIMEEEALKLRRLLDRLFA